MAAKWDYHRERFASIPTEGEREREGGRQMARQDKRGTRFEMLIVVKLGIIVKSNKDGNRCISY